MSRSAVAAVLAERYPGRELAAVEPVTEGNRRRTAVARFAAADPLVVQLSPDADAVRTEATLARAIRARTSVPVPAPLAAGTHDGTAYLVGEHRPGTDLHATFPELSPDRQRWLAGRFGRYLAELHDAFAFDGCGDLASRDSAVAHGEEPPREDAATTDAVVDDDVALAAPATDRDDWLVEYGLAAVDRLPAAFDPLRDRLVDCLRGPPSGTGGTARLFPWDLRPGNALVDDGDLSAVVDWERPLAGPSALAVAKVEYLVADWYVDDPAPLRTAFRRGYERVRSLPTVRPAHRVAAVADSAVDSRGQVTTPRYPEVDRATAVAFHRDALERAVSD